jgi:hypothetical protein
VQPARDRLPGFRPERKVVPLGEKFVRVILLDAERPEEDLVEALRHLAVGDPDAHVIEHALY